MGDGSDVLRHNAVLVRPKHESRQMLLLFLLLSAGVIKRNII